MKDLNISSSAVGDTVPLEWVDRVVVGCAVDGGLWRTATHSGTRMNINVRFLYFESMTCNQRAYVIVAFVVLSDI